MKRQADGAAVEGMDAGGQLVKHDAGGEEIGARIDAAAADLLGRHVGRAC